MFKIYPMELRISCRAYNIHVIKYIPWSLEYLLGRAYNTWKQIYLGIEFRIYLIDFRIYLIDFRIYLLYSLEHILHSLYHISCTVYNTSQSRIYLGNSLEYILYSLGIYLKRSRIYLVQLRTCNS
jgi:hypothetical protein